MLILSCPKTGTGESRLMRAAAEGERPVGCRAESLRQKDRAPEDVLESPVRAKLGSAPTG